MKDAIFEILKSLADVVCLELKEKRVLNLNLFGEDGLFFRNNHYGPENYFKHKNSAHENE